MASGRARMSRNRAARTRGSVQSSASPGRHAARSQPLRSTTTCVPASASGDKPRMMASAVHTCGSVATHAAPVGLAARLRHHEDGHRIDIRRQWRFGALIVGHRDDAQCTTPHIVEIDDLPIGTLRVELRHWQWLRPASGSTQGVAGVERAQVVDQMPDRLARQSIGEARHRDRTIGRRDAVRDEPVELAIAMRSEMVRGEIGRRQRQRPRGRTIASRLDAVADDAVRGEQSCAMRDRRGGELGGRGEEAGRIGSDEQQIQMRRRQNLDDHGRARAQAIGRGARSRR